MLSLSDSAQVNRWIERLHRLQRTPWIVYGSTFGAILIATFVRWALGSFVHDRIPFTTYYPAIVLATLLGGSIAWIVVRTDSPLRGFGRPCKWTFPHSRAWRTSYMISACGRFFI